MKRRRGLLKFTHWWWWSRSAVWVSSPNSAHSTLLRSSHFRRQSAANGAARTERETTDHAHNGILCAASRSQAVLGSWV